MPAINHAMCYQLHENCDYLSGSKIPKIKLTYSSQIKMLIEMFSGIISYLASTNLGRPKN